ncbi:hypothetical protein PQE68_gp076 [Bacillus phage vB_BanS_Sophrita]|uniref:Uncharacterized protein n=1 Tax=Bacillus phage vB_BanS_Sophrita TaxID=2894790 RepID=A0AAE8YXL1_9CAUD|nr:hypothetical protein PQE68_gp076 [Bacillus phage vB_BanS_Sophrita]UGO50667.1 hypothetical protein SOPHRITA_76 [Bacillus phage vB_BanS_Sophrita]
MEKYYMIFYPYGEAKFYVVSSLNDYSREQLMKDEDDNVLKFEDEDEAVKWLLDNIKEVFIPKEYLSRYNIKNNRKRFFK